jgi:alkylhydroperoxidase family enzyme
MSTPRISYVPLDQMDERMQEEMDRCAREGTPRPESSAVRAHVPAAFWAFADSWKALFHDGVCDHAIKELCRVYISRTVTCEFCGNQRSIKGREAGLEEAQYDDLLNFESSDRFDDRQKAALAYAQAIAWNEQDRDGLWDRLNAHFSEAELVELGCCIALTFGQQSWIRLLDIDHHQYLPGTDASMAPGFEDADRLAKSKASEDYWATAR